MSIKLHCLHCHLASFLEIIFAVSVEQGERFHQDLKVMEKVIRVDRIYIWWMTIFEASNMIVLRLNTPE